MTSKMPSEEIDKFYSNLAKILVQYVPTFQPTEPLEFPYAVTFEFGQYFIEHYSAVEVFSGTINFLNDAIKLGSSKTEEVINLQFFTQLFDMNEIVDKLRKELLPATRLVFDYCHLQYLKSYCLPISIFNDNPNYSVP